MTENPSLAPEHVEAIREARSTNTLTRRPTVDALEEVLYEPIKVLDHGFVRVVDYMGNDTAIVQAARVSYGKGTHRASDDRGLIRYLMRHSHTTPFEMATIKLHVKLPIFVARQWIRHRTASVNEYSARYSVLDREFYLPAVDQLAAQSTSNNQGRSSALSSSEANETLRILRADSEKNYDHYLWMLNEDEEGNPIDSNRSGLARELARINLTLSMYTQWYWKIDLHNLLNFLSLRVDQHAQYEIRAYAEVILSILKKWVPETHGAFIEYRLNSLNLSSTSVKIITALLHGRSVDELMQLLSARERRDLENAFDLTGIARGQ